MATARLFETERTSFVAGLFWQPLAGAPRERRKAADALAKELQFDLAVWRSGSAAQIGFAASTSGAKPGLVSAAAMVAEVLESELQGGSFVCAVETPGHRWLYVAQREGLILSDGDLLAGEDEVRTRLLSDLSVGAWDRVFTPEHWGIEGAKERSFAQLVPRKADKPLLKRGWRLAPLRANRFRTYLVAATVLLLIGVGAYEYRLWQQRELQAQLARLAAQSGAQPAPPLEHPWKKQPRAREFLQACTRAFGEVKTWWPGNWTLKQAACENGSLNISWARQDTGWIEHLRALEPRAFLSADGSLASLTLPMQLPAAGEDEAVPTERARTLALHAAAQRLGVRVTLAAVQPPPVLPGDKPAALPAKDWNELTWSVQGTRIPPAVLVELLDGPGLRLDRIEALYEGGFMNWSLKGTQYVQR